MKQRHLVCYDYGMGGLWAYIWAESEEDITRKLDVQVKGELPTWLAGHEPGLVTVDIDGGLPDWLTPD